MNVCVQREGRGSSRGDGWGEKKEMKQHKPVQSSGTLLGEEHHSLFAA